MLMANTKTLNHRKIFRKTQKNTYCKPKEHYNRNISWVGPSIYI